MILSLTWVVLASKAWAADGADVVLIPGAKLSMPEQAREFARGSERTKTAGGCIFTDTTPAIRVWILPADISDFGKAGESVWELAFAIDARGIKVVMLINPNTENIHFNYDPWIEGSRFETIGALDREAKDLYTKYRGDSVTEGVHKLVVRTLEQDVPGFAKRGESVWEVQILNLDNLEVRPFMLLHPFEDRHHYIPSPGDEEGMAFATYDRTASLDRIGPAGGALARTIIVSDVTPYLEQLSGIAPKLRVLKKIEDEYALGPESIIQAAQLISKNAAISRPPDKCLEYEGVFYFSGGTTTKPVEEFQQGMAVRRDEKIIYVWP